MSDASTVLGIPRKVLIVSAVLTAILALAFAVGLWVAGVPGAIALGMGFLSGTRPATTLPPAAAAALAVPAALAGAVAVGLRDDPLSAACFVALCCLMVAPAEIYRQDLLTGIPTAVAVLVAVPGEFNPAATAVWMLAGNLLLVVVAKLGRFPSQPAVGAPARATWIHAFVMAATVGLVVYAIQFFEVPHGYWVAVTLTMVLRPLPTQSRAKARQRTVGSVVGVVLALVLAWLLPSWGVAVALVLCVLFMIAYALVGNYVRQMVFLTPTVVLLAPAGGVSVMALERVVATLVGTLLAGALALLIERLSPTIETGIRD